MFFLTSSFAKQQRKCEQIPTEKCLPLVPSFATWDAGQDVEVVFHQSLTSFTKKALKRERKSNRNVHR
jgi:hypothetical protein